MPDLIDFIEPVLEPTSKSDLEALRKKIFEAQPTAKLLEAHEKIINELIDNPKKFAPNLNPELGAPELRLPPGTQVKVLSTDPTARTGLFGSDRMVKSEPSYIMKKLYKSPFYKKNPTLNQEQMEAIRKVISQANNNQTVLFGHELNPLNTNYVLDDSGDYLHAFVKLTQNQQKYRMVKALGWTGVCLGATAKEYFRSQSFKVYGLPLTALPKDIYTFVAGSTISYFLGEFMLNNLSSPPARLVGWTLKNVGGLVYYLPGTVIDQIFLGPIEEKFGKIRLPINITKENGITEFKSTGEDASKLKKIFRYIYDIFSKQDKK